MSLADYHTHTPWCRHATGSPEAYVDAAVAAGLVELGISDHAPQLPEPFDDWRMMWDELPAYFDWIERARTHAGGRIEIRAGLECDWLPGCEGWIEELAQLYPWDYLIGSVHYLGDWDFDHPKWLGRWAQEDLDTLWGRYWATYADLARSGCFEILGHADLVKKFAYRPEGSLDGYYELAISAIAESGAAIELNTAGWHKPCAEAYPSSGFLRMAAMAGVPLVISSDAHAPDEVARDFGRAVEMAQEAGFRETVRFHRRERTFHPLPMAFGMG